MIQTYKSQQNNYVRKMPKASIAINNKKMSDSLSHLTQCQKSKSLLRPTRLGTWFPLNSSPILFPSFSPLSHAVLSASPQR